MKVQAWPFLVSRNRYLGYQTVVAPSFMVEADISDLLANYVGGNPSDYPQYLELPKTKVGNVSVVYRVVPATSQGVVFRDESARPILWIEGVVLQASMKNITFSRDVLQEAHHRVEVDYREFWEQTNEGPVRHSQPFLLVIDSNQVASITLEHSSIPATPGYSTRDVEPRMEHTTTRPRSWYTAAVLLVLFIVSMVWGIVTSVQNRQLASQVHALQETIQALQKTPENFLPSRTVVPTPAR